MMYRIGLDILWKVVGKAVFFPAPRLRLALDPSRAEVSLWGRKHLELVAYMLLRSAVLKR